MQKELSFNRKKFGKKINLERKLVSVNHILTFGQIDDGRFEKIYSMCEGMRKVSLFSITLRF